MEPIPLIHSDMNQGNLNKLNAMFEEIYAAMNFVIDNWPEGEGGGGGNAAGYTPVYHHNLADASTITANVGEFHAILFSTGGNTATLTAPANPEPGDTFGVSLRPSRRYARHGTVTVNRNSKNMDGVASNYTLELESGAGLGEGYHNWEFIYVNADYGWLPFRTDHMVVEPV